MMINRGPPRNPEDGGRDDRPIGGAGDTRQNTLMNRTEVVAKLKAAEPQLRAYGVAALYLFGSYAREEAREDSDIDVFVDPGTEEFYSLEHFVGAYEVLQAAVPGWEIGYGTRNGLSTYIKVAVEKEAVR